MDELEGKNGGRGKRTLPVKDQAAPIQGEIAQAEKLQVDGGMTPPDTEPVDVKPAKATAASKAKMDLSNVQGHTPEFLVGDLVWAKMKGHPWCPCMVSRDPLNGHYVRGVGIGNRPTISYHMQFFGDIPERAWVRESSLVSFEGLTKFQEYSAQMAAKSPKTKAKMGYVLHLPDLMEKVKNGRWKRWHGAVKEAEEALLFSRDERKVKYTFMYEDAPPKDEKPAPVDVMNSIPSSGLQSQSQVPVKCKYETQKLDTLNSPKPTDTVSEPPPKKPKTILLHSTVEDVADKEAAQLSVYCLCKKDAIRCEHPGITEEQIHVYIFKEWSKMTSEQKAQFVPTGSDVLTGDASPGEVSGRTSPTIKPSKKCLEADDENEISKVTPKKRKKSKAGKKAAKKAKTKKAKVEEAGKVKALFCGNLSPNLTDDDLKGYFEGATAARIPCSGDTGKPRGYGFVEFRTHKEACTAKAKMEGVKIDGRSLRIDFANGIGDRVASMYWAPHEFGLMVACGNSDGSISVISATGDGKWNTQTIGSAHKRGCIAISWSPAVPPGALLDQSGSQKTPIKRFVSGGCDNLVKIWKEEDGNWVEEQKLEAHSDWVRDVAWAPYIGLPRSIIASCSKDCRVIIWTNDGTGDNWVPKTLNKFHHVVWHVRWSVTGNILSVSVGNNEVSLWKEAIKGQWICISNVNKGQGQRKWTSNRK